MKSGAISVVVILSMLAATPAWAEKSKRARQGRAWIGLGTGVLAGGVEYPCTDDASGECDEGGVFQSYSANLTVSGRGGGIFRLRGVRAEEDGAEHHPYEMAALFGSRFGRSNWYGLLGAGRVLHADDEYTGDAKGFAWEILFAPSSTGGAGFELSFQGHAGHHVGYAGLNVGMRFGRLR